MAAEQVQKNGGEGNSAKELLFAMAAMAEAADKDEREQLQNPMAFMMDTIKNLQGGEHDQEAIDRRRYGSRARVSMPYGFDDPDEGLKNIEDILLFLDDVLTQNDWEGPDKGLSGGGLDDVLTQNDWEGPDKGLSGGGLKGLGYLCRLMWFMIGDYRTDTFNSLDHLQRLLREKAKQEKQEAKEQAGQE
ncbi:MAG: hypothetical protein K9K64_05210 [Desulfohalobiaceae bacterium]|nr:hypothetical protein [Desulfohalobiaceae bacterium]